MNPPAPSEEPAPRPIPPGWKPLEGGHLPSPTFWPAGLALAVTFILWGLISSWVVLVIGLWLFAASLGGWVADIRHERKSHH